MFNPEGHALITHHTTNTRMAFKKTMLAAPPLENHCFSLDVVTTNKGAELVTEPEEGKEMMVRAHLLIPGLFLPLILQGIGLFCPSSFEASYGSKYISI